MTPPARADEVPDTERCHTWLGNRWLTDRGLEPEDDCNCCTDPEERP